MRNLHNYLLTSVRLPVALGAVLFAASAAQAQDAGNILLPTVEVQANVGTAWGPVDGYVPTNSAAGTKTDTPLIETPRAISVVSAEEISDRGAQSVTDAVAYSAGVVTGVYGYEPRFDVIYVRGFATTQLGDYRDGLRQTNGLFAYFRTEPYGLERIDIIKGPASVLYGQTVPGGLVNRVSKLPTEKAFGEAEVQIGSPDWYQAAFDVGGPVTKDGNVLYRVTGVARKADGSVNGSSNDELFLAPTITFRNDTTNLTILGSISQSNVPASNFYLQSGVALPPTKIPTSTNLNDIEQTQEQIGYRFEHEFNDTWTVRQNLRYGHIDLEAYYGILTGGFAAPGALARYPFRMKENLDNFNVDNQAEAKFATGPVNHRVLFGLDYLWMNNNQRSGFGSTADMTPLYLFAPFAPMQAALPGNMPNRTSTAINQLGVYASDQMSFGDGWHFNIGVRQDFSSQEAWGSASPFTNSRDDNAFTWQTGLLYEFSNGVAPYVSYATSFMPSTSLDVNGDLLEPSYGEQYEAGIKFAPKGMNALFTVSAYQITQSNYAQPVPPFNTYSAPVGDIRVRGIEFEAAAQPLAGLEMTAAYTYSKGEITASLVPTNIGNVPVNMPEHTGSIWAKYMFQDPMLKGFGVGAGVRYIGEFYADTSNVYKNPAQTMVDAALYYEKDAWKFQLNAKNLFDEEVALQNEGYWYWTEGRTILLSAKYTW
ncbi:TonB-dependent siderophore receptor [Xanthobacteraceae bacterium A53D]